MKRKAGLFLFAVMLAVSVGATVVASLAMYRLVSHKQDNEIRRLEVSLSDRFAVFETMLRSQHHRMTMSVDFGRGPTRPASRVSKSEHIWNLCQ